MGMSRTLPRFRPRVRENWLRNLAALIWRWLWLIILITLVSGGAAYFLSTVATPIYQARTTLLISEARGTADYQDILASERMARTYAELMTQGALLDEVAATLGLTPRIFDGDVTAIRVETIQDTQLIAVEVEGISPQLVTAVANTLPVVFIGQIQSIQDARWGATVQNLESQIRVLEQEIDQTQAAIAEIGQAQDADQEVELGRLRNSLTQLQASQANLIDTFETVRLALAQSTDSITVVDRALPPTSPIRPRPITNTLLAALAGALLALAVILLINYLDDRIRSPDELSMLTGAPWMGAIGKIPDVSDKKHDTRQLITVRQPRHPIAEAFRSLRTNLQFSQVDTGLAALVVTSAEPGEGKTTTAANLAVVMAQSGLDVLLVDTDLRRPVQHRIFEMPQSPGLSDALLQPALTALHFVRPTPVPNLRLLTAGSDAPNPAELLGSKRMWDLFEQLKRQSDLVIFDAPPALAVTDAQVVGRMADGALLVVDGERTRRNAVVRAAETLQQVNIPILGSVINRLNKRAMGYYYSLYQTYYSHAPEGPGPAIDLSQNGAATGPLRGERVPLGTEPPPGAPEPRSQAEDEG